MAVVAVSFDGSRVSTAGDSGEGGEPGTLWDGLLGGNAVLEADFVYQANYSISFKVKTSENGVKRYNSGAGGDDDLETTPRMVIFKHIATTPGILNNKGSTGGILELGNDDRVNYYRWYVVGGDTYPVKGGWLITPIDPNVTAFIDATVGTPDLTIVDYYAWAVTYTATSKAENTAMDAIDFVDVGEGLTLVGGDGVSDDGIFDDFVDFDEGTQVNRYGIVSTQEGILYIVAVLTIGSATATEFTDSNKTLIFPGGLINDGAQGVDIDLQSASTAVSLDVCTFKSNGRAARKRYFDTVLDVNAPADDAIFFENDFEAGDYVLYSKEGGSHNIGLTDDTYYWVAPRTATTIRFYESRANALTDGVRVQLTALSAPGENHSIIRVPDPRMDFSVSGTSGTLDMTLCVIDGARIVTLTSAATMEGGFIQNSGNVIASTADITRITTKFPTLSEGLALLDPLTTPDNIIQSEFIVGEEGHAWRITSTAGSPYTSDANLFTDYWAPADDGWNFHTITGVDASTDVITTDANHGFVDGDAVFYNSEKGYDSIGLTDRTTIDSHSTGGTDDFLRSTTNTKMAQSFTNVEGTLVSARFKLKKVGSPTGNATAYLYAHSGTYGTSSVPTGSALATSETFDVSTLTTSYAEIQFNFPDRYLMTATYYCISVEYSGGDGSNYVQVDTDNADGHSGNQATWGVSGPWSAVAGTDCWFQVHTDGPALYYVNKISDTTLSLHATRSAATGDTSRIDLSDGTNGETHSLYSGKAAVFNDTGDEIELNAINLGDKPSIRNGIGATTISQLLVTVTITCKNEAGNAIEGVRVRVETDPGGTLISQGSTNASGIYTFDYNYTADTDVLVKARLKGYKFIRASSTIVDTGLSIPFTMIRDQAVFLP